MLTLSVAWWWIVLIALAAVAGATWSYARTRPALPPKWQWGLGTLRAASLFLIGLLLLQPFWTREQTTTHPPKLAVALDNSASMMHTGIDTTDASLPQQLETLLDTWDNALDAPASVYPFDAELDAETAPTYDGARTNITAALQGVPRHHTPYTDTPLEAIALVSDGRHNAGPSPLQAAERSPVPIYPVVVGDTLPQRDVQVRRIRTNDIGYTDTPHPIEARIRSVEGAGETLSVTLREGDTVLDETDITLPEGTADQPVDFSFTPEEPGTRTLTVAVDDLPDQATDANNEQSVTVRIEDRDRTAWILAGSSFPDVGALRRAISANPEWSVQVTVLPPDGPLLDPLPTDEDAPNVVILAGLPTPDTPESVRNDLQTWIDTKPLLFFWGPNMDASRLSEWASNRLPATVNNERVYESGPTPTTEAPSHPAWTNLDNEALWSQLPPVLTIDGSWQPRPDARVLARTDTDAPLITTLQRNRQRSALVSAHRTWRWTTLPASRADAAELWPTLVTNLVRWADTDLDDPVRVQPDAPVFAGTEEVTFSGRVLDGRGEPADDARVDLTITDEADDDFPFTMTHAGGGQYQLDAGALPEGTYTYTATATRNGTELGTDAGDFSVDTPNVEQQETHADVSLMRQIAARSGGEVLFLEEFEALPDRVQTHPEFTSSTTTERSDWALNHAWPLLLVIISLLSAEWYGRTRQGLA